MQEALRTCRFDFTISLQYKKSLSDTIYANEKYYKQIEDISSEAKAKNLINRI